MRAERTFEEDGLTFPVRRNEVVAPLDNGIFTVVFSYSIACFIIMMDGWTDINTHGLRRTSVFRIF